MIVAPHHLDDGPQALAYHLDGERVDVVVTHGALVIRRGMCRLTSFADMR